MKKKILYLILLVFPLGFLSANNNSHYWPSRFFNFKKTKPARQTPAPKQENNFELLTASWL